MESLLFLSQRLPYPPDKGDKIRSWHILEHLSQTHRIFLGCFIDDPGDWRYLDFLKGKCADVACFEISPWSRRLRSVIRLRPGKPLTLDYFHDERLHRWVREVVSQHRIRRTFAFSSSMAPYALGLDGLRVLDLVDLDSAKWAAYAERRTWPASWIFAREGRTLAEFERRAADEFDRTLLVSKSEADDFLTAAPALAGKVDAMPNGVDLDYFSPARTYPCPYAAGTLAIVFTGAMDYWPNIDAARWFATEVFPALRTEAPSAHFYIVGSRPDPTITSLRQLPGITVTGRVSDIRPYLAHAFAAVAPLRVARGIQNKVLEAMALQTPVVASPAAARGIVAQPGTDLLIAEVTPDWVRCLLSFSPHRRTQFGRAGRDAVAAHHRWDEHLSVLDRWFPAGPGEIPAAAALHR